MPPLPGMVPAPPPGMPSQQPAWHRPAEEKFEQAIRHAVDWIEETMTAHEAWTRVIMTFLESFVKSMRPPLIRWELKEFGSHHYGLSLPDSDVDVQLQLPMLPAGLKEQDVTMAIGQAIRQSQWAAISDVSDAVMWLVVVIKVVVLGVMVGPNS